MRYLRNPLVILFQAGVAAISLAAAYAIRFDFSLSPTDWRLLENTLRIAVPIKLCAFYVGRLHRGSWRHAALPDLVRIACVNIGASILSASAAMMWVGPAFPRSVYVIDLLICFLATAGARYSI